MRCDTSNVCVCMQWMYVCVIACIACMDVCMWIVHACMCIFHACLHFMCGCSWCACACMHVCMHAWMLHVCVRACMQRMHPRNACIDANVACKHAMHLMRVSKAMRACTLTDVCMCVCVSSMHRMFECAQCMYVWLYACMCI